MKKSSINKKTEVFINELYSDRNKAVENRNGFTKYWRYVNLKMLALVFTLSLSVFFGCNEKWNPHYNEGSTVVSDLNLLEYLKTKPEYSKYVEVLERTGVAEELTRDQNLTVWVVNNDGMAPLDQQTVPSDTFIIRFHINSLSLGLSNLYDGQRLPSLNGKYIAVSKADNLMLVGTSEISTTEQFCKNGVIHEIDALMTPTISIYEYLNGLGDNYSSIVDSIFSKNDTIFDEANSTPIGVDITGNTVYDSVFVIDNPLFDVVDIRSEFEQITMFLPDNEVLNECLTNYVDQLEGIGRNVEHEDSILAFNWIISALFYDGLIKNYGAELDLESIDGKIWRTSIQQVSSIARQMSNGLVYDITKMKIPNNVFITRIKSLFHYIEFVPEENRDALIQYNNTLTAGVATADSDNKSFVSIGVLSWTYKILKITGDLADGLPAGFETSPIKIETLEDNTILGSEMKIPGGEYKFYLGFQAKNHGYINVYFNGEMVAEGLDVEPSNPWNYDRNTECTPISKWDGLGGLVSIVNIPGNEMSSVKIKIEFNRTGKGTAEEVKIYHWALVPTENNY